MIKSYKNTIIITPDNYIEILDDSHNFIDDYITCNIKLDNKRIYEKEKLDCIWRPKTSRIIK